MEAIGRAILSGLLKGFAIVRLPKPLQFCNHILTYAYDSKGPQQL